jgi:ABC-2 type transport system permease protein
LFLTLNEGGQYRSWFPNRPLWGLSPGVLEALAGALPWTAATRAVLGESVGVSVPVLLAWALAGYAFGRWQFERGLRFDADTARATTAVRERSPSPLLDRLFRWPARLFPDPLAAMIEKEIRFLARAPRFRLVFTMGFTFGLVIWLPIAGRGGEGVLARNFLTLVSLYSLLLLGDVCFWNTFGFDRRAAQIYFAAPVKFATVILAKNITALFFVLLEITLIIAACSILRMPVTAARLVEAYAVTLVITLYLVAVGNLTSTYHPRGVDPDKSMRKGSAGRMQALFVLVYPFAGIPVALAYGARYAFGSAAAFYGVLGITAVIGAIVYWVALESALEAAAVRREQIVDRLSQGEGPIGA